MIPKTGKRFGINVIAAISNRGELYFTCYTGSFDGPVFLEYLKRLVRHVDRKIHLMMDGHPVHRRVSIHTWLAEHGDSIEMHFLPDHRPELDPVELLNGDLKHHVAQANPTNRTELAAEASGHPRRRQNQPNVVKALFHKPEVRYATGRSRHICLTGQYVPSMSRSTARRPVKPMSMIFTNSHRTGSQNRAWTRRCPTRRDNAVELGGPGLAWDGRGRWRSGRH